MGLLPIQGLAVERGVERLVKIEIESREQLRFFTQMQLNLVDIRSNYVTAEATDEQILNLRQAGFKVTILLDDVRDAIAHVRSLENLGDYHNYSEMVAELVQIANTHPTITMLDTIGYSVQNRLLLAMKISDNPRQNEDEAVFQLIGAHHGNELIGNEVCIYMINYLTDNYPANSIVKNLVDNREIWIVPMPNPDGVEYGWRYNANGVDLNRDYGYMWEGWGGSSAPFSQPEVKALRALSQDYPYTISISYHSGTEYVIYPWCYHPDATKDDANFATICNTYGSLAGYPVDQTWWGLYEVHGGSMDYSYGCDDALGFSVELSYDYAPPPNQIDPICQANRDAILYCIDRAGKGIKGIVTDSETGEPLSARIYVQQIGWPVITDSVVGDYHRFLLPGTYTVIVSANGHQPKTFSNVVVYPDSVTTLNVQLDRGGPNYAHKVVFCKIADPYDAHNNHTLTTSALGAPDGVYLSIGVSGWIAFDMGEGTEIVDRAGKDFKIYEAGSTDEGFTAYVSNYWNGPWQSVGTGMGTTEFDIAGTGLSKARYVKIVDD